MDATRRDRRRRRGAPMPREVREGDIALARGAAHRAFTLVVVSDYEGGRVLLGEKLRGFGAGCVRDRDEAKRAMTDENATGVGITTDSGGRWSAGRRWRRRRRES